MLLSTIQYILPPPPSPHTHFFFSSPDLINEILCVYCVVGLSQNACALNLEAKTREGTGESTAKHHYIDTQMNISGTCAKHLEGVTLHVCFCPCNRPSNRPSQVCLLQDRVP